MTFRGRGAKVDNGSCSHNGADKNLPLQKDTVKLLSQEGAERAGSATGVAEVRKTLQGETLAVGMAMTMSVCCHVSLFI